MAIAERTPNWPPSIDSGEPRSCVASMSPAEVLLVDQPARRRARRIEVPPAASARASMCSISTRPAARLAVEVKWVGHLHGRASTNAMSAGMPGCVEQGLEVLRLPDQPTSDGSRTWKKFADEILKVGEQREPRVSKSSSAMLPPLASEGRWPRSSALQARDRSVGEKAPREARAADGGFAGEADSPIVATPRSPTPGFACDTSSAWRESNSP